MSVTSNHWRWRSVLDARSMPFVMAWATPSGPLTAEAYGELTDRLIQALEEAGPVDAVLLALHGAMVADQSQRPGCLLAHSRLRISGCRNQWLYHTVITNQSKGKRSVCACLPRTTPQCGYKWLDSFTANLR